MPRLILSLALLLFSGCALLTPPTWQMIQVSQHQVAPKVLATLKNHQLEVEEFQQTNQRVLTRWMLSRDINGQYRERYEIDWKYEADEKATVVYVRHRHESRKSTPSGYSDWGSTSHDTQKEDELLDAILKSFQQAPVSPATTSTSSTTSPG